MYASKPLCSSSHKASENLNEEINNQIKLFNQDFQMLSKLLTVSHLVNKIRKLNINNEFSKVLNYGLKEKIIKKLIIRKFKS